MKISLNGGDWRFKGFLDLDWVSREAVKPNSPDPRWWRSGTVPGSVHDDLWQHGVIPDPYVEQNTLQIEWVAQRTWVYKKTFHISQTLPGQRVRLIFEGVDYEAEFYLNGALLGRHRSQFIPAVFDITERVNHDGENLIAVVLFPAPPGQSQMGRTSLVNEIRTRMNYGWDFCPRVVHLGVWDSVWLEITGAAAIEDVWVRPHLSDDFSRADVDVTVEIASALKAHDVVGAKRASPAHNHIEIEATFRFEDTIVAQVALTPDEVTPGIFRANVPVEQPHLWWPNGSGEQPLYQAEIRVFAYTGEQVGATRRVAPTAPTEDARSESDRRLINFGIRRIEFVQNERPPDITDPALNYTLVVNGRKLYMNGWNWVPMDVLYGVEHLERQEHLLRLAQAAHVNILRVVGVGLIQKESFYDLCDRLGILIWQEFIQSSSGIDRKPKEDPAYIELAVREAESAIKRRRNHPALALWCGGNELEGLDLLPLDDREPVLAALKETVRRLDPDRGWLPTSGSGPMPYCGINTATNNPFIMHDVHGPWHHQGLTTQYTLFNRSRSLLHSEFGAEGLTNLAALEQTLSPENRWPATRDNRSWYHLGGEWWLRREEWAQMVGEVDDLPTLVTATQVLQAEAVRYAIEANRRRMFENSGSFPWQFNEPYPMAVCTTAVDYFGEPRLLYHAVARAYEPVHVSARFDSQVWPGKETFEAAIWVSNATLAEYKGVTLEITISDLRHSVTQQGYVSFGANTSTALVAFSHPLEDVGDVFWLDVRLGDISHNQYQFSRQENLAAALPHFDRMTAFWLERTRP
ncbi:MAG: glycoside hydrolase family 2 TIM barrel-domain containing protein [bacterium]|nr:glycoside hydrolase family 2 TIM barrel-domain containing protein [bacterium]